MRGKCLNMIHVFEDNLWALGDKTIKMPLILSQTPLEPSPPTTTTPEKEDTKEKYQEAETVSENVEGAVATETESLSNLKLEESDTTCNNKNDGSDSNEEENKADEIDHEKLLMDSFLTAVKFKSKDIKLPVIVSTFMKTMQTCW